MRRRSLSLLTLLLVLGTLGCSHGVWRRAKAVDVDDGDTVLLVTGDRAYELRNVYTGATLAKILRRQGTDVELKVPSLTGTVVHAWEVGPGDGEMIQRNWAVTSPVEMATSFEWRDVTESYRGQPVTVELAAVEYAQAEDLRPVRGWVGYTLLALVPLLAVGLLYYMNTSLDCGPNDGC